MDVITILDKTCSGKTTCSYVVDDLRASKPCPPGLASYAAYLEASYQCISGMVLYNYITIYWYVLLEHMTKRMR